MHIDRIAELRHTFHTASRAAPEAVIRGAVNLEVTGSHRLEVGRHTGFRILRGQDRVVIGLLIEVHIFLIAGALVELTAEFQHVIGVTGFAVAVGALLIEDIVHTEVFPLTVSACDIGMMRHDHIPESFRIFQMLGSVNSLAVDGFAVEHFIALEGTDEFRNCRICVSAVEDICAAAEHLLMKGVLIEIVTRDRVIVVSGDFVELIEAVIHAAVFDRQNGIMRLLIPCFAAVQRPVTEAGCDRLCKVLAGELVDIDKTLDQLMHRVPRHPGFIDNIGLALLHQIKLDLNIVLILHLTCPEEAGFALGILLALSHAFQQRIHFIRKRLALCVRQVRILIRHCNGGKIVSDRMTSDQRIFPACITLCAVGVHLCILAESAEQSVRIKRKQILDFLVECVRTIAVSHRDITQAEIFDCNICCGYCNRFCRIHFRQNTGRSEYHGTRRRGCCRTFPCVDFHRISPYNEVFQDSEFFFCN